MESMIHLAAHIVQLQTKKEQKKKEKKLKLARDTLWAVFSFREEKEFGLSLRPPIPIQRWALFHLIAVLAQWCGDYVLHRWESASVK